jgi:hypothetical protein
MKTNGKTRENKTRKQKTRQEKTKRREDKKTRQEPNKNLSEIDMAAHLLQPQLPCTIAFYGL